MPNPFFFFRSYEYRHCGTSSRTWSSSGSMKKHGWRTNSYDSVPLGCCVSNWSMLVELKEQLQFHVLPGHKEPTTCPAAVKFPLFYQRNPKNCVLHFQFNTNFDFILRFTRVLVCNLGQLDIFAADSTDGVGIQMLITPKWKAFNRIIVHRHLRQIGS